MLVPLKWNCFDWYHREAGVKKKKKITIGITKLMFFHMKPLSTDIQEIVWSWCPQHFSVPSEPKTLLNINITNSSSLWHFYARLLFIMIANWFLLSVHFWKLLFYRFFTRVYFPAFPTALQSYPSIILQVNFSDILLLKLT